jgi:truncated hemoglobin YjbI
VAGDDPTLYEWAGGQAEFDRMINAFYDRVEADDLLSPFLPGGVHEDHRRHVATWWAEVFGGPAATPSNSTATSGCFTSTSVLASRTSSGSGSRH